MSRASRHTSISEMRRRFSIRKFTGALDGTHSLDGMRRQDSGAMTTSRRTWERSSGAYPEYEFGMQIFTEEQAEKFSFDVLDATKLVPEELVSVTPVGKMVLNRNPDNFFAETEQVAFCAAHIVPGLDFSNDPLLAGRIHSYQDTHTRWRPTFMNSHHAPVAPHKHHRKESRQAINRGRVAYEPNSLAGGCPFQAGVAGFTSFPEPLVGDQVRGKPEKFADHYTQATLFWNSQTAVEKAHIARFVLSCRVRKSPQSARAWSPCWQTSPLISPRASLKASVCRFPQLSRS